MSSSRQKTNFTRTCSLLSRYVKEKGSIKDLNLEIGGKILMKPGSNDHASTCSTMNLLMNMEKSGQVTKEEIPVIDLSEDSTTAQAKAAPLTIFYSGKLLVFEEFSADKAKELFTFARNTSLEKKLSISSNPLQEKPNHNNSEALNSAGVSSNIYKETNSAHVASSSRLVRVPLPLQPDAANGSDLPIARRSSLHRFLEKRKDRAATRGPYQVPALPISSSNGDDQLELRL